MQALQLYYTSCRKGQSGGSGFQIHSLSEGITEMEKRSIITHVNYIPPRDLNREPDLEEAQNSFPRAFRFYRTESGRWALTLSCYVGRDYDGIRFGNFFSHTLLFESGFPRVFPVDYYDWSGWQTYLDSDKAPRETPPPLMPVELGDEPLSDSFSFAELKEFILENPVRAKSLPAMIHSVILKQETNRPVIIRDLSYNGIFWIACLQKAFPLHLLDKLDFSTYQESANNCASLNATTTGTDFLFNEMECNYQFYMFDFIGNNGSDIDVSEASYAGQISQWLLREPAQLEKYHRFANSFEGCSLDTVQLSRLITLYKLHAGQISLTDIDSEEMNDIADFMIGHIADDNTETVKELISAFIPAGISRLNEPQLEKLFAFAVEKVTAGEVVQERRFIVELWLDILKYLIEHNLKGHLDNFPSLHKIITGQYAGREDIFAEALLESNFIEEVKPRFAGLPIEIQGFILKILSDALVLLKRTPIWGDPEFQSFIEPVISSPDISAREIVVLFRLTDNSSEMIVRACNTLVAGSGDYPVREENQEIIGEALGQFMEPFDDKQKTEIRENIYAAGHKRILLGEWRYLLDHAEAKDEFYKNYNYKVLRKIPDFAKECQVDIDTIYFSSMDSSTKTKIAGEWIIKSKIDEVSPELIGEIIKYANFGISLDPSDSRVGQIAKVLSKKAKSLNIDLDPDRPLIRRVMRALEKAEEDLADIPLEGIGYHLSKISGEEYGYFLKRILMPSFSTAKNAAAHKKLITALYLENRNKYFQHYYAAFINECLKEKSLYHLRLAVKAWLSIETDSGEKYSFMGKFKEEVLKTAQKRYLKLNDRQLMLVKKSFEEDKNADEMQKERYRDFFEKAEDNKSKFGGIIKNIFKTKDKVQDEK